MKPEYSIQSLCQTPGVSPSGYYDWKKRRESPGLRTLEDQVLTKAIGANHARSRFTYGSPRVVQALLQQGRHHGRNQVARLM